MDRLSYKDGYLKGIFQSLNTLLEDGIISKKQWEDYKDKLFNVEIVVPEKCESNDRNYIEELRQIYNEKKSMEKMIPRIIEIDRNHIWKNYGFKNINEILVKGVGIPKSTASEILFVSKYKYYYDSDGSIKPEWENFNIKNLLYLARSFENDYPDLEDLRKQNIIRPDMKHEAIKEVIQEFKISRYLQTLK